ncbi:MAG TPA: hypothetical protein VFV41_01020 [Streptosporangiaceae bacterium]|nr:hypothetical protein [Streptosporangiaceae bacterium]
MTTYDVTVTREDDLWVADITGEGLGPAATDVERFADLDTEVRDLIAGLTDADPGSLGLAWRYEIGGEDVTELIASLAVREDRLREATSSRAARPDSAAEGADRP